MTTQPRNAFTLIEFLIALVIIGFIVAILVGVFSNPVKQAKTDSAVSQIKDGLRTISDALNLAVAKGAAGEWADVNQLVVNGYLAAPPGIPAGAGDTSGNYGSASNLGPFLSTGSSRPGGCGPNNVGASTQRFISLRYVSDEVCMAYNEAEGLTATILPSCLDDNASCAASGSADDSVTAENGKQSYCSSSGGWNAIVYWTGVTDATQPECP